MPAEGLDLYEQRYGGKALTLLREAKEKGDQHLLEEAAQRYFHTVAGVEANERLATMHLDRSEYFLAALRFGRMLKLPAERHPLSEMTLFKAALSYRRAGDKEKAEVVWKRLDDKLQGKEGLRIGDNVLALNKIRAFFEDDQLEVRFGLNDWPMIRGDRANNAQGVGSPPLLDQSQWVRKHLLDNDPTLTEAHHDEERLVKTHLDSIFNNKDNHITMPGSFPIVANGRLIYRAYGEVRCIALRPQTEHERVFQPGDTIWRSVAGSGSAVNLLHKKELANQVQPWLSSYASFAGFANLLFENTTLGTISTDHQYVYYIEDLAIPPPDNILQPQNPFMPQPAVVLPEHSAVDAMRALAAKYSAIER